MVRKACKGELGNDLQRTMAAGAEVILVGAMVAYLVGPALAHWLSMVNYISLVPVFVAANLLGAAFPLLAHAAVDPAEQVGSGVSRIYLSNIVGSTLGSFLVGFWVLDRFSTRATSVFLLGLGLAVAGIFVAYAGGKWRRRFVAAECAMGVLLLASSGPLFKGVYERLLFKTKFEAGMKFSDVVENRSGVIAVYRNTTDFPYPTDVVYGGGAYDGRFNVDLRHDSNGLFRAFAVTGMHPDPRRVLMVGLASASWAQVIAGDPRVKDLTIVEINPGYLGLIREHAEVASLLENPKVHVIIDDGRRWLVGHPGRQFDLIVNNITFNWRAHATNLLSTEFLRLARGHLAKGGILYYNTTWSERVMATGIAEFPYALRVNNFLAVSDSAFGLDEARWAQILDDYRVDGKLVFDQSDPEQKSAMEKVLHLADELDVPKGNLESRSRLMQEVKGARLITDDNMGTEWEAGESK